MGVKMVREPSDTPNINNIDDFIGLRYSYGNQNGYVKDKGSEIGYEINGSIFKIKSGRIVLQGVECDVDANGVEILIDSIANKRYHVVYLQVSLANMSAQILEQHDTASYPSISAGDDFNADTTGTGRVILYKFTSTNGNISAVSKVLPEIVYSGRALDGYDIEKGTVEQRLIDVDQRLTELGFKHGSIYTSTDTSGTPVGEIIRQGNFVIIHYNIPGGSPTTTLYIYPDQGTSALVFRPKEGNVLELLDQGNPSYQYVVQQLISYENFLTIVSDAHGSGTVVGLKQMYEAHFGYEAVHDWQEYIFDGSIASKTSLQGTYVYGLSPSTIEGYEIVKVKISNKEYNVTEWYGEMAFATNDSYNIGENLLLYAIKRSNNL